LTSVPMWALIVVHCAQNWGFWTLLTEIPSYMDGVLGFDLKAVKNRSLSVHKILRNKNYRTAFFLRCPIWVCGRLVSSSAGCRTHFSRKTTTASAPLAKLATALVGAQKFIIFRRKLNLCFSALWWCNWSHNSWVRECIPSGSCQHLDHCRGAQRGHHGWIPSKKKTLKLQAYYYETKLFFH
jgi:hypothetical protein